MAQSTFARYAWIVIPPILAIVGFEVGSFALTQGRDPAALAGRDRVLDRDLPRARASGAAEAVEWRHERSE